MSPYPRSYLTDDRSLRLSFRDLVESLQSQINPSILLRIQINLKPLLSSIQVQLVQVLLEVNYLPKLKLLDHPVALAMVPLRGLPGFQWLLRVDWYWLWWGLGDSRILDSDCSEACSQFAGHLLIHTLCDAAMILYLQSYAECVLFNNRCSRSVCKRLNSSALNFCPNGVKSFDGRDSWTSGSALD